MPSPSTSGLAESEMCLPQHDRPAPHGAARKSSRRTSQLAAAQEALVQSEKLASMGQLAAGIAHEVNNPLGVVLMYSHLLLDDCEPQSKMREDLAMIAEQADRCKKIVAGLLHFARQNKVVRIRQRSPRAGQSGDAHRSPCPTASPSTSSTAWPIRWPKSIATRSCRC